MSEETVSPLLAAAAVAVVFLSLALIVAVEMPGARMLRAGVARFSQVGAFAVAAVAMGGSLYYSEIVSFVPCEFCWYQRIAMYPLAVILFVAVVTRARIATRYIATVAAIGLALSTYHYQLQLFPEQATTCSEGVPCSVQFVDQFGFVSIPFMAGCGFLAILFLQVADWRARRLAAAWDEDRFYAVPAGSSQPA